MNQRPDATLGAPKVERRSALRLAGDRLKDFADRLNSNARWIKQFLARPK